MRFNLVLRTIIVSYVRIALALLMNVFNPTLDSLTDGILFFISIILSVLIAYGTILLASLLLNNSNKIMGKNRKIE